MNHGMTFLNRAQIAMCYRLADEEPPPEIAEHHPLPCNPIADKTSYLRKLDPKGVGEFLERCGYGEDEDGETTIVPIRWVLAMIAKKAKIIGRSR